MIYNLPQLDGSGSATCDRLDAWLSVGEMTPIEDSLAEVQAGLSEALTIVRSLNQASVDCDNESCAGFVDAEYLRDELLSAKRSLGDVESDLQRLTA